MVLSMNDTPERIAEVRRARRLSREGLAELLGVSEGWVSNRELGRVSPSIEDLDRLAVALNVPRTTLLEPALSEVLPSRAPVA